MHQAASVEGIFRILKNRIGGIQTVSFDVFDTLLGRRIDPPDLIHQRVAQQLASWIQNSSWQSVLKQRYQTEKYLREMASKDGWDRECNLEENLELWLNALGINNPDLLQRVLRYELQLEKNALYLQDGIRPILQFLTEKRIGIFALSDVYIKSNHLREFFENLDVSSFFKRIYSSADSRLCKYSGRLFEFLIKEHQIEPATHIHIGDNRVSDFLSPRKVGIQSIYLHDPQSMIRRERLRRYKSLSERKPLFKGRYFHAVLTGGFNRAFSGFYERYGHEVLGPIFALLSLELLQKLSSRDYDLICFVARDGYLLQRLVTYLIDLEPDDLSIKQKFKYLHISRKTGFAALAADGLDIQDAKIALYSPTQRGIESILKNFSLPISPFQELSRKYGFAKIDDPIYDLSDQRLTDFLGDAQVQRLIKTESSIHKNHLLKYLKQQGLFNAGRVALVDIGWNGTIQYALHKLTMNWNVRPVIDGYYFAYSTGLGYSMPSNWRIEGIIYDELRKHPGERSALHFEEIFEEAARSLEGTTIGYDQCPKTGTIRPVLKEDCSAERTIEIRTDSEIVDLQRGILSGLENFIRAMRLTGFTLHDLKPYFIYHLERALVYPSVEEVTHLSKLTHSNDFGHDTMMDLASISTRKTSVFQFKKFLREVYSSDWIYGKMTGLWFNLPRYLMRVRELSRLNGHA
jgi:predicted HAD superfamily hydrolase